MDELKKSFEKDGYYGILFISPELINTPNAIQLISRQQPPIGVLDHIENSLKKEIEKQRTKAGWLIADGYWIVDPYIRNKSHYDRLGLLPPSHARTHARPA